MLSTMQFVYLVPVVVAVVVAGLFAGRNVTGRARGLLWTGIALVIVAQLSSLFTPLLLRTVRPGALLSIFSMASLVVSVTGIVLLIVAVGQAGRAAAALRSGPQDYRYPPGPASSAGYPAQPGDPRTTGYPQPGGYGVPGYAQPGVRPDAALPAQPGSHGPSSPAPGASPWGTPGH